MEVAMIAKIIIKRRFVKENTPQILSLLNKIRSIAMNQPGYISGETLDANGLFRELSRHRHMAKHEGMGRMEKKRGAENV